MLLAACPNEEFVRNSSIAIALGAVVVFSSHHPTRYKAMALLPFSKRWPLMSCALQLACCCQRCAASTAAKTAERLDMGILDWIHNAEGGYFNPKQELRTIDSTQSALGVFAVEDIEEGEVLMTVPWDLIIQSDDKDEEGLMCCGTVAAVLREMKLGEKSKYHPYPEYLKAQPDNDLPSNWSEKGKDLLYAIIGVPQGNDPRTSDFDSIPPEEPVEW